jgi:hypothetical protein
MIASRAGMANPIDLNDTGRNGQVETNRQNPRKRSRNGIHPNIFDGVHGQEVRSGTPNHRA